MKSKISPSMMCADVATVCDTLEEFRRGGIEFLHIDIMDGSFVPNFTLGTDFCKMMKKHSEIPLDLHLMIERPEEKLHWFPISEGDIVSVHAESTKHLQKALSQIRALGARPFVAVNPATPLSALDYVLDDIDGVLVMTVNPGFAGQKLVEATVGKIKALRDRLDREGYSNVEIEVDGNVSLENARRMRSAGANIFVAGTSGIFKSEFRMDEAIAEFRKAIM